MKTVYVSSTYADLTDHRAAVSRALRMIGYHVVRPMEEAPARATHTRAACEEDVVACDLYVGIFAWRYGTIPALHNEGRLSITELEYRKAVAEEKPCLIFLVAEKAGWPPELRDSENGQGERGERIRRLRDELRERCAAYFTTPDQLSTEVLTAVRQHEATKRLRHLDEIDMLRDPVELGPSYLPNIVEKIAATRDAEIVELRLGPTPWWTTRLHLLAALAGDYTTIKQFIFLDAKGRYLAMAPPAEVRRALAKRLPRLERAYRDSRDEGGELHAFVMSYMDRVQEAFDGRPERDVKENVSPIMLRRDLGIESSAESLERREPFSKQRGEILRRGTPYVVLVQEGRLVSVIDRVQMASAIAERAIEEL